MSDDFSRVKDAINLVQYVERQGLEVKREGAHHKTRCIFHDDTNPSLVLYDDGGYKCFACHASGDVFNFAEKFHNWTKAEALIELARYAGVTLEPLSPEHAAKQGRRERLYALLECAEQWFRFRLNMDVIDHLTKTRGLAPETIAAAGIGYAPDTWQGLYNWLFSQGFTDKEMLDTGVCKRSDKSEKMYDFFRGRIVIPMRDHKHRVVGFSARAMDKGVEPKYLNSPQSEIFDKGSLIYTPMSRVKNRHGEALDTIVVVEGHMDAISALNRNFGNVKAQMGTSLTDIQLSLLCSSGATRLVFCLDNDTAGHEALKRLVVKHMHVAASKGVDLYAMTAPHGKDPDDTFREAPHLWQPAVDAARHVTEVLIDREVVALGTSPTPGSLSKMARELLPILKSDNPFTQKRALQYLADSVDIAYNDLKSWLDPIRVLPKPISAPMSMAKYPNLPTVELIVLHGILVNEDPQRWIDRANAVLSKMPFPKACEPLSQNDFIDTRTRGIMALITTAVDNGIRPFDDEVRMQIGNGHLNETYYRATCAPEVQAVFASYDNRPAFVLSYDDFLKAVYLLRHLRLAADIAHKRIPGTDLVEWVKCKMYLWQLAQKGYALS